MNQRPTTEKIAFLFAGQGAQSPGMGYELSETSPAAASVFEHVDAMRPGTSVQCFSGTCEELAQTINTQPCLFAVDLAAARALESAGIMPDVVAGFSLGEISALAFAGILSDDDAFELVMRRGAYMDECAHRVDGAMAAVLGAEDSSVEEICQRHGVYPVNYNCPGQIVISGQRSDIEAACAEFKAARIKTIALPVSGAFHTPYMQEASHKLAFFVRNLSFGDSGIKAYSNYTARPYERVEGRIMQNIVRQVKSPVRWREVLEHMAADGVRTFIEVGPGKTLSGFVRKTVPNARVFDVADAASLNATIAGLA